jgi:serine protease
MKRFVLIGLCLLSLFTPAFTFSGTAAESSFESIVLDFRDNLNAEQLSNALGTIKSKYRSEAHYNSEFSEADHIYVLDGDQRTLQGLQRSNLRGLTEYIEPNYVYKTTEPDAATAEAEADDANAAADASASAPSALGPNDPDYAKQWNLKAIGIESAWQKSKGKGVTVAVIDTGVSPVPDLDKSRIVEGYNFVADTTSAIDDHGHGTHVAGTIAQTTNNRLGVAGVAYEAQIMPLKVLSAWGGGTTADIAESIRWAADHGADVINMSLGGGGESKIMKEAIDYAHEKGVVIVAAAGNSRRSTAEYPARYEHVIGVSAIGRDSKKAGYSNYGPGVDIAAPGGAYQYGATDRSGGILQNTIDAQSGDSVFEYFQGTSMAAPHVAGVAALVRSLGVTDPDRVEQVLKKSAILVKDDPQNAYGAGQLNADNATIEALKAQSPFLWWLSPKIWGGFVGGLFGLFSGNRLWFDGSALNFWPKVGMIGLAWAMTLMFKLPRNNFALWLGLILGSSGLFVLRGVYLMDLPQWPLRVLSSSIPELVGTILDTTALNPLSASVLIPFGLMAILLGNPVWKLFAIGSGFGVAACLAVSAVMAPEMQWITDVNMARAFLGVNAILTLGLTSLSFKDE